MRILRPVNTPIVLKTRVEFHQKRRQPDFGNVSLYYINDSQVGLPYRVLRQSQHLPHASPITSSGSSLLGPQNYSYIHVPDMPCYANWNLAGLDNMFGNVSLYDIKEPQVGLPYRVLHQSQHLSHA